MPKHTRSSSSAHHQHQPYASTMPMAAALAPAQPVNVGYSTRPQLPLNTGYYPTLPSTQQQQQPMQPQYDQYAAAAVVPPPIPHRASSGAWSPQDDQNLLSARQQGLNWAQIRSTYFPSKTPNACRKRHERLMERKGADDWDVRKLENIAKEYMSMRKEIWQPLAHKTGEKWSVVEAKCMNSGLKNIQNAARAGARRERAESGQSFHGYDDDSGISGIGLTPVDDLDASYSSPETATSSSHSTGGSFHGGYHMHMGQQAYTHGYPASTGGLSSSGYSSSVSSSAAQGYGTVPSHSHHSQGNSPYMGHGQRLPSVDMGIGAIINRPQHGGNPSSI
ncbi:putative Myb-like domain-containing protein [Seiridium unicorne]|uniref:Myb-like domain-containing protein n=1 Tax=Seiridium unicorne TaxID=138068 RepID=A0ABR2V1Z6_9PEZI